MEKSLSKWIALLVIILSIGALYLEHQQEIHVQSLYAKKVNKDLYNGKGNMFVVWKDALALYSNKKQHNLALLIHQNGQDLFKAIGSYDSESEWNDRMTDATKYATKKAVKQTGLVGGKNDPSGKKYDDGVAEIDSDGVESFINKIHGHVVEGTLLAVQVHGSSEFDLKGKALAFDYKYDINKGKFTKFKQIFVENVDAD